MATNQNKILLKHFKRGGTITHSEALLDFGIANLSGRVAELRQSGQNITDTWEEGENRFGQNVRWKRYRLTRKRGGRA